MPKNLAGSTFFPVLRDEVPDVLPVKRKSVVDILEEFEKRIDEFNAVSLQSKKTKTKRRKIAQRSHTVTSLMAKRKKKKNMGYPQFEIY